MFYLFHLLRENMECEDFCSAKDLSDWTIDKDSTDENDTNDIELSILCFV